MHSCQDVDGGRVGWNIHLREKDIQAAPGVCSHDFDDRDGALLQSGEMLQNSSRLAGERHGRFWSSQH